MSVKAVKVPDDGARPFVAKWADGVALKASLAACEVRLFQAGELEITPLTTLAELDAVQADYSGYTAGGIEVAAAGDPYGGEGDRVFVTLPSVQFNHVVGTPNVENTIRGAYVVDSAGVLRGVVVFSETELMVNAYSSIVVSITFEVL